ncbi:MAG: FecR domain-containing protein [Patescibacteria group bacterium]
MSKHFRVLVLLALLPALGAGCFQVGPRVVQGPQTTEQKQVAKVDDKKDDNKAPTFEDQYESVTSSDALAYLELKGGKAKVSRAGLTVDAADGMEIESGDRLKVDSGTAYLVYPGSGKAQLETGTDLVFLAYDNGGLFVDLKMAAGRVWTRFERLLGANEQYEVTANGVVATVRGTAFGVSLDADGVDVQVADHYVAVMNETSPAAAAPVKLSAGEGLKIVTKGVLLKDIKILSTAIRRLSATEQLDAGFKFGSLRIPMESLVKPINVLRLRVPASVPFDLQPIREQMLQRASTLESSGIFVAPTRVPTTSETAPLNTAPTINGPTTPLRSG